MFQNDWKRSSYFILLATILFLDRCSSSPTNSGDTTSPPPDALAAETKSDTVGSIPEDMLAAESKTDAPAADASTNNAMKTDSTPQPSADGADPFAELKTDAKKNDVVDQTIDSNPSMDASQSMMAASTESEKTGQTEAYKVQPGDTLMKVAFTLYGDLDRWKEIRDLNQDKLKKGNTLRAGMELKVETPAAPFTPEELSHSYTIKHGDTLANIADDLYGKKMKYKKIQKYNSKLIRDPNRIFSGFKIFYDITPEEVAEAEAHKQKKLAASADGNSRGSASNQSATAPAPIPLGGGVPSAINPPKKVDSKAPLAMQGTAAQPAPSAAKPAPAPATKAADSKPTAETSPPAPKK